MRLLLLLCASSVMILAGPVYIDELEDLLPTGADKRELDMLENDKNMISLRKGLSDLKSSQLKNTAFTKTITGSQLAELYEKRREATAMEKSEKQRRLDAILQRQPDNIQQIYKTKVAQKQAQRASKQQHKQMRADQQGRGSFVAEELAIDNDMSISSAEADRREYELKRRYNAANSSGMFDDDDD